MSFGRVVKLYAGKFDKGNMRSFDAIMYDMSDLDIEFEVKRSIEWFSNEATVSIYNPSPSNIAALMGKDCNSIVLQAGYEDERIGTIFIGNISSVIPRRQGSDIVVKITAVSARGAFYQLARLHLAAAFKKDSSARDCLQYLCDYAGIVLRSGFSEKISQPIGENFDCSGTFRGVCESFFEKVMRPTFGLKGYLDNNELILMGIERNNIELETINLDYGSGLLECYEVRDENNNKINFGNDPLYYMASGLEEYSELEPKSKPTAEISRVKKINFKALMNPSIAPNIFVNIDSSVGDSYDAVLAQKGKFIITDCNFNGGNFGSEFSVTCNAEEVE